MQLAIERRLAKLEAQFGVFMVACRSWVQTGLPRLLVDCCLGRRLSALQLASLMEAVSIDVETGPASSATIKSVARTLQVHSRSSAQSAPVLISYQAFSQSTAFTIA